MIVETVETGPVQVGVQSLSYVPSLFYLLCTCILWHIWCTRRGRVSVIVETGPVQVGI